MKLRDYQEAAVRAIFDYFAKSKGHPLVAAPTGTGKTLIIAGFLIEVYQRNANARTLCATHVKKLISQNYEKLMLLWPQAPAGIYSAGLNKREIRRITFAGIGSIYRQVHLLGKIDLFIIDEAHLLSPNEKTMYRKLITALLKENPAMKVIGLTATPWRLGQGELTSEGGIFTDVCIDMTDFLSFNWFIKQGYIVPLIAPKTKLELDTSEMHLIGGDFNKKEHDLVVNRDEITEAALREVMEAAFDRKQWLIFAGSVDHAKNIQRMLEWLGISCNIVHSKQPDEVNDEQYKGWEKGSVRAIVNYGILTTGVDSPNIDCIVLLRATASSVLLVQMLGRGTRTVYADGFDTDQQEGRLAAIAHSSKRNCLVLDFGKNIRRLGPINDPVIPRRRGGKGGDSPVRECPACGMINHISVRYCGGFPYKSELGCGYQFPISVKINDKASTDEIIRSPEEFPILETFEIHRIEYSKHQKRGSIPILKVTYWNSINSYNEWVSLEAEAGGPAHRRAVEWWRKRIPEGYIPATVDEALSQQQNLATPTHMRVHVNKKFPEIKSFCFDGTAFGTQPASSYVPRTNLRPNVNITDDDIPF